MDDGIKKMITGFIEDGRNIWGIDRVLLNNLIVTGIYPDILLARYEQAAGAIRISKPDRLRWLAPQCDSSGLIRDARMAELGYIKIADRELGMTELQIRAVTDFYGNPGICCSLNVTIPYCNLITSSIKELRNRIRYILMALADDYGIVIEAEKAVYKEIEIAYTWAQDAPLDDRQANLILLRAPSRVMNYHEAKKISRKGGVFYIPSRHAYSCLYLKAYSYKLYDKIDQLKGAKEIDKDTSFDRSIYRFEVSLRSTAYIQQKLKHKHVFKEGDCLSDDDVGRYLEELLEHMFGSFYKARHLSEELALKKIKEHFGRGHWLLLMLADILNEADKGEDLILDLRSMVIALERFAKGRPDKARTLKNLMENDAIKDSIYARQDGAIVFERLADMKKTWRETYGNKHA